MTRSAPERDDETADTFTACDTRTWPVVLTLEQVCDIYQRTPDAIRKAVAEKRFVPAPFLRYPARWRRADVLRNVEGQRRAG